MKLAIVLGTRPEIIKFSPIIKELEKQQIKHKVYFTSQHFSVEMGKNFFKEFGIKVTEEFPDKFKDTDCIDWLEHKISEYKPDCVLVQGDTVSALCGALAAINTHTKLAHVEAGLRSFNFNEPYPEEYYRTMIDSVADYLFCPTEQNKDNIRTLHQQQRFITGNTIIDLVKSLELDSSKSKQVLITIHRRENWERIKDICRGIDMLSELFPKHEFIWVTHANKNLAKTIKDNMKFSTVKFIKPQPYIEFIKLINESKLVITDSGGLVEECSALRTPLVIVREETERQEAVDAGCAVLAGTTAGGIVDSVSRILANEIVWNLMQKANCPFGDGKTSKRIIHLLKRELE